MCVQSGLPIQTLLERTMKKMYIAAGNPNDPLRTVRIRNLNINGTGASGGVGTRTGIRGIRIIDADAVFVEDVLVSDFTQQGISDERVNGGSLNVTNTTLRHNAM